MGSVTRSSSAAKLAPTLRRTADNGLPVLYKPGEVADAFEVSEWWIKEQARKGRIPFTRLGGAYRFTAEHVTEIIHLFEEAPPRSAGASERVTVQSRRHSPTAPPTTVRLTARTPRRAQRNQSQSSAA